MIALVIMFASSTGRERCTSREIKIRKIPFISGYVMRKKRSGKVENLRGEFQNSLKFKGISTIFRKMTPPMNIYIDSPAGSNLKLTNHLSKNHSVVLVCSRIVKQMGEDNELKFLNLFM